jgi:CRP-like cAMP-binding protein/Zn-dependent protease
VPHRDDGDTAQVVGTAGRGDVVAGRAELALLERLVRATTSFDGVPSEELRDLLRTVHRVEMPAGARIVAQGEAAEDAYVVVSGRVEVIDEGPERVLATLGQGALFGEAALVGNSTRNATVRALEKTVLLVLARAPLLDLVSSNAAVKSRMIDLFNSRDRPKRSAGIEEHRQRGTDGAPVVVLKNPARQKYLRLSGDSLFVWERCDGSTTIRDLATALFSERQRFAPATIVSVLAHLRAEGFLQPNMAFEATRIDRQPLNAVDRIFTQAKRLLTASAHYDAVDPVFAAMFRRAGFAFFTRPGAIITGLLCLAGMALFARSTANVTPQLWTHHGAGTFFALLVPAYALLIILHECGHGLAVKAIGRKVESVGIGWYWFGPIAFVDTSDAWAGTRAERILVSAAGPIANLLLAAAASAVACWARSPAIAIAAWQFALIAYVGCIQNLNPLLEFDGYYILVDLLERPNLRRDSLRWLGSELPQLRRRRSRIRGHVIECSYALGAVLYIGFAATQSAVLYHAVGQARLATLVPGYLAAYLAWILPLVITAIATAALLGEMRKVRDRVEA